MEFANSAVALKYDKIQFFLLQDYNFKIQPFFLKFVCHA